MDRFYYFTYGSNMLAKRLQERCPSAELVGSAYVCGYGLKFSKRSKDCSGKATIVESKGNHKKLYGALFQIDKSELRNLDKAEGIDYERQDDFIVIKVKGDEEIEVTTYFAKPSATGVQLKPYEWYKQLILWGAFLAELPNSYRAKLVAIETDSDSDNQRNNNALGLLKSIPNCVFPKENWDMKIADQHTVADWKAMKAILVPDDPANWEDAFNLFFRKRIETRYFEPIRLLQDHGENKGEGFSIVTLQCSLIEFLASTREGLIFAEPDIKKCAEKGCLKKIVNDDSHSSAGLFKNFVGSYDLFNTGFSKTKLKDVAKSFYADVRCALLHDARTKGNWIIHADSGDDKIIEWKGRNNKKILYRNNLQNAFEEYIKNYGKELTKCKILQEAFIRKFDSLCEE